MDEAYRIEHYTDNGEDVLQEWLKALRDNRTRSVIDRTIRRLEKGNFGVHRFCRDGVWELVIDYGPGYRVYYSKIGNVVVLLLCAGSKRTQNKDIERAVEYLKEFKRRNNDESGKLKMLHQP